MSDITGWIDLTLAILAFAGTLWADHRGYRRASNWLFCLFWYCWVEAVFYRQMETFVARFL